MSENSFEYMSSMQSDLVSLEEMENKEFSVSRRGFDQMEVQSFLRRVALSYRHALSDKRSAQASLDKVQHAFAETIRHSDAEIAELRREVEEARNAGREAMRQRDEAEKVLRELRDSKTPAPILPTPSTGKFEDPYDIASQQVKALLRAADETATEMRRESETILASSRTEAEKVLLEARESSRELEIAARAHADEYEARAEAAAEQCRRVVEAMHTLERQVQSAVSAAMENLETKKKSPEAESAPAQELPEPEMAADEDSSTPA